MSSNGSGSKPSFLASLYASVIYYPTLAWNIFNGRITKRWDWWNSVTPDVVLGAVPFRSDIKTIHQEGVGAIVNTCEEFPGHCDLYEQYQITQHHMPTVDFTHPSLQDVKNAVEFMKQQIELGKKVYVHCKAGRARSATVVICYLIKEEGMQPEAAQQLVLGKRKQVLKSVYLRPVVQQFAKETNLK